jgi:molecular chaperone DnaK
VEAKNHAEALVHSTEKALAEHGTKIGEADRSSIENAMADLKEALKGDDPEAITAKANALAQASMKLGEAMYKQQQESAAAGGEAASGETQNEDVVDAEFTEVNDDKNNKKSA